MWVEISTESMHSALLFSMKPIPPMSAARLNTVSTPSVASRQHVEQLQVGVDVLDVVEDLVPLVLGLAVDGADAGDALIPQPAHEVAADEPPGARDQHVMHAVSVLLGALRRWRRPVGWPAR